jgi:hypothetical protein
LHSFGDGALECRRLHEPAGLVSYRFRIDARLVMVLRVSGREVELCSDRPTIQLNPVQSKLA